MTVEQFPSDVRIVRRWHGLRSQVGGGRRGDVRAFSEGARRRLRFSAANAFPGLVSQVALTYHLGWPDGLVVKQHLNRFLVWLRARLPGVGYLWVLEFQRRGAPHFHLWLTVPCDRELGIEMGAKWNRIAAPGDAAHLAFHQHERNFIPWAMGSGAYLCKYLEKAAQKAVPEDFGWPGRFWASSRNLVPEAVVHQAEALREGVAGPDPVRRLVRDLGRFHESRSRRFRRRSNVRRSTCTSLVRGASAVLSRLLGGPLIC